jgi:hypothetical protein
LGAIAGGDIDNTDGRVGDPNDLPIFQGRDRAFSFEVFNFSGGDDLLPVPVESSAALPDPGLGPVSEDYPKSRPRGDSIIFDPSSFQDGGIHEKKALEKTMQNEIQHLPVLHTGHLMLAPAPVPSSTKSPSRARPRQQQAAARGRPPAVPSKNPLPHRTMSDSSDTSVVSSGPGNGLSAALGVDNRQIATLPSALSESPATFQMDLLNKDGRIGIYLPEARRARIARFHAKRKMRIWRKRIKYDCRKKLADSRPRIKGRFVKRSDMDDDN